MRRPERRFRSGERSFAMPILILIVLAIMIAQIGFWETLSAVLGAAAMVVLLILLAVALVLLAARYVMQHVRSRL
jgi:uncharacterized membrane protein YkvI